MTTSRTTNPSRNTTLHECYGLLEPLQRLDQRLQQTLEISQVLCGTAFQTYLLGSIEPVLAPGAAVQHDSALGQLKANFGLSHFEVGVVVMAIAPELDRRYERLYSQLQSQLQSQHQQQQQSLRKPTLSLALNVLCNSADEKRIEREKLAAGSPLLRLLQPLETTEFSAPAITHKSPNHKSPDYKPPESQVLQLNAEVSQYLLNQRSLATLKTFSTYAQLAWPQAADNTLNSATENSVLSSLIARVQQGDVSLPLSLKFSGQCAPGKKHSAAMSIAIETQKPLLRVNLLGLINKAHLNADECNLAVERLLLQCQLWQALLYLEDPAELPTLAPTFIHPGLIERLSIQLARYPGIAIFAGHSPYMPEANNGKGILQIPFADAEKPKPILNAAHLALSEIDKFRAMLMRSSVEFG